MYLNCTFQDLGLAPLHIAVALPCREGIEITRLLLEANANPDLEDLAFGQSANGRTALHIACTREDDNKVLHLFIVTFHWLQLLQFHLSSALIVGRFNTADL